MIHMSEEWRDIRGFPGYQVSDHGRVRSDHLGGILKILKSMPKRGGYFCVNLYKYPGCCSTHYVHILVLKVFVGPRPVGMEARHLNSDRTDNRLTNLRWDTHAENCHDQVVQGLQRGSKNHEAKLDEAQILAIRKEYHKGNRPFLVDLADKYDVSISVIGRVVKRQSWRHVE